MPGCLATENAYLLRKTEMLFLAVGYIVNCNIKSFSREYLVLQCVTIQESILKTAKRELLAATDSQKATSLFIYQEARSSFICQETHCHLNVGIAIARLEA